MLVIPIFYPIFVITLYVYYANSRVGDNTKIYGTFFVSSNFYNNEIVKVAVLPVPD